MKRLIGLLILATAIGQAQQTVDPCTVPGNICLTVPTQKLLLPLPTLPNGLSWDGKDFIIGGKGAPSFGTPVSFSVPASASLPTGGVISVNVPYASTTATQNIALVAPAFDPGIAFTWQALILSPGVVTVRIKNESVKVASLPAGTWIVKVL